MGKIMALRSAEMAENLLLSFQNIQHGKYSGYDKFSIFLDDSTANVLRAETPQAWMVSVLEHTNADQDPDFRINPEKMTLWNIPKLIGSCENKVWNACQRS